MNQGLSIELEKKRKKLFPIEGGRLMKITYEENAKMNHHEIRIVTHPKNKKLVRTVINQIEDKFGEIEVYDDMRNQYYIPILSIYYIEIIDHRIFAYTDSNIYKLRFISTTKLSQILKPYGFYKVNVRTLVNKKYVVQYHKVVGSRRKLILENGEILISSRRYKEECDRMIKDKKDIELVY